MVGESDGLTGLLAVGIVRARGSEAFARWLVCRWRYQLLSLEFCSGKATTEKCPLADRDFAHDLLELLDFDSW
jgi:hypothetical protein